MILLGIDEMERNIAGLILRKEHSRLFLYDLQRILPYLVFIGIEMLHILRIKIRYDNLLFCPSNRKSQMVRQRKIDMIKQLHVIRIDGIIDHILGDLKIHAVCLGGQSDNTSGNGPVPQHKHFLHLLRPELIAGSLVKADPFSHQYDFPALFIQCKHQRIIQNLHYPHLLSPINHVIYLAP